MNGLAGITRDKLGVALAGGGFRASLFHLGVLRRMAELDLLRYVEVLSTVSGGSIVGALYALLLKKHLERPGTEGSLRHEQYLEIVDELTETLTKGVQKNLRTRLFMNPLGILRVLTTPQTLGKRMARLYERYLFRKVVNAIHKRPYWQDLFKPGRIPLGTARVAPGGADRPDDIEQYNSKANAQSQRARTDKDVPAGSAITKLVVNATSLNSGARFWFSGSEIGDWFLGYIREDELKELSARKLLLEEQATPLSELRRRIEEGVGPKATLSFALWWRQRNGRRAGSGTPNETGSAPAGFEILSQNVPGFPGRIPDAHLGWLRLAKIEAWYIRHGRGIGVTGGLTPDAHEELFWDYMKRLDHIQAERLRSLVESKPDGTRALSELLDFVLELYLFRTAAVVSPRVARDWERLTLGEAVGASACFPPVFPPFQVYGFYDDVHVSRLGLTDGGVFDNVGLTALLDEGCNYIIASDTSGVFAVHERATAGRLGMMGRIVSVLMVGLAWKQRESLLERSQVSRRISEHIETVGDAEEWSRFHLGRQLHGMAFFQINSPKIDVPPDEEPGLTTVINADALARIRTDLDGFGDAEITALVDHGYDTADRSIRRHLKDSPFRDDQYWRIPPQLPMPLRFNDLDRIIETGRLRFGRALRLGAFVSWFVTALAGLAVLWGLWSARTVRLSVQDMAQWIQANVLQTIEASSPWFGTGWTGRTLSIGMTALVLVLAIAAWITAKRLIGLDLIRWVAQRGWIAWARRISTVLKWARGTAGNLLWAVGALPLLIAIGSAVAATISHLFFCRPFLSKTRAR